VGIRPILHIKENMTEQEAKTLISEFEQIDLLEAEKYKVDNPIKWVQYCIWHNCKKKKYTNESIINLLNLLDFVTE